MIRTIVTAYWIFVSVILSRVMVSLLLKGSVVQQYPHTNEETPFQDGLFLLLGCCLYSVLIIKDPFIVGEIIGHGSACFGLTLYGIAQALLVHNIAIFYHFVQEVFSRLEMLEGPFRVPVRADPIQDHVAKAQVYGPGDKSGRIVVQQVQALPIDAKGIPHALPDIIAVQVHIPNLVKRGGATAECAGGEAVKGFLIVHFHVPTVVIAVTEIFPGLDVAIFSGHGVVMDSQTEVLVKPAVAAVITRAKVIHGIDVSLLDFRLIELQYVSDKKLREGLRFVGFHQHGGNLKWCVVLGILEIMIRFRILIPIKQ